MLAAVGTQPARQLDAPDLNRYLEFCTDLLALISKLAALHDEHEQDEVILEAVNDIETLTNGLSRKIWQKIAIVAAGQQRAGSTAQKLAVASTP